MSATKYMREVASLEKKCRKWKTNPRRSLELPSRDEWNRHVDGFSVPKADEPKRRVSHRSVRQLSKPKDSDKKQNPIDISDYSSSDEDNLNDIQPLNDVSPNKPEEMGNVQIRLSTKRKRNNLRLSTDFRLKNDNNADITADSPAKPEKVAKRKNEQINRIDSDSPADKKIIQRDKKEIIQPDFSQGSNSSVQDYSICDYSSQTVSHKSTPDEPASSKGSEADSLPISTASSSPSERDLQKQKRRSSQWLQNLQWGPDYPTKDSDDDPSTPALEDSAKKKKEKFTKGGLADRLQKMIRRKQSTQNIWNHKMATSKSTLQDTNKNLTVQILSAHWEFSVLVSRCSPLASSAASGDSDKQNLTVLFAANTTNRLELKTGSIVQIHPPWQSFHSPQEGKVVLCTHFCHKLPSSVEVEGTDLFNKRAASTDDKSLKRDLIASWQCPCVRDGTFPRTSCRAQTEPCQTDLLSSQPLSDNPTRLSGSQNCRLRTEIFSQSESQVTSNIMECIENQGGFGTCGISLRATVQRIFYRRSMPSLSEQSARPTGMSSTALSCRTSVLLQDGIGMCCEVLLPAHAEQQEKWRSLCDEGEGKVWSFTGLRQQCRLNKNRDPGLFHMIESISPAEGISAPGTSSQSDSQQSQPSPVSRAAQTFCYRLLAPSSESSCRLIGSASVVQSSSYYTLSELLPDRGIMTKSRVSILCRIIHIRSQDASSNSSTARLWYITDNSLQSSPAGYCKVTVQPACWLSTEILDQLEKVRPVIFLRDVVLQNGQYICDGYSRVHPASFAHKMKEQLVGCNELPNPDNLCTVKPSIGDLTILNSVSTDDLISITGEVTRVNESTAYTWDVCDQCKSTDLHQNPAHSEGLYCKGCGRTVKTPETRINLEVYVRLKLQLQSNPIEAKIKLLQHTIESLLPQESTDEGYDVQCIMGKALGPLSCIVTNLVRTTTTKGATSQLKEIHMYQVLIPT